MKPRATGNVIFVAALGMVLLGLSSEVRGLHDLRETWTPDFLGKVMWHIGTVIGAYVGGRIIPRNERRFGPRRIG